jgi:integrase
MGAGCGAYGTHRPHEEDEGMSRERGTGSLRLRGGIWWARYHHGGKLVEESTGERDERKARTVLRQKVKRADTPLFIDPSARKLSFDDLIALVRADAARKGNRTARRLGTATEPGAPVAHLAATFGGWPALAITSDAVDRYGDGRLAAGAKPATLNRELSVLLRGFRLAVRKGMLPTMPAVTLRSEAGNERQGFVDPADFEALLGELRQREDVVADLVETAYLTLLRRSNVRNLAWPLFRLDVEAGHVVGGELRLPSTATKNKKPLALPLTGRLLAVVDRRWQARLEHSPYVFHRDGRPVVRFKTVWREATAVIGRSGLLLHDLRRSGARTLIRAGVPEDVVMRLGGWRTRSMLTRYNIVDTSDLVDAQAKLDAALAAPGPRTIVPLRRAG